MRRRLSDCKIIKRRLKTFSCLHKLHRQRKRLRQHNLERGLLQNDEIMMWGRNNRKTFHPIKSDERKAEQVLHDISIHTYYYDNSILDGYTLKILREEIETSYKNKLKEIYEDFEKTDDLSE